MSGDVQPRKRKDKRRKKDVQLEYTAQKMKVSSEDPGTPVEEMSSSLSSEEAFHIHKDGGTGGNVCAKIVFFSLLGGMAVVLGLILVEYRGSSDSDTNLSESHWAPVFEGWVDNSIKRDEHHETVEESEENEQEKSEHEIDENQEDGDKSAEDDGEQPASDEENATADEGLKEIADEIDDAALESEEVHESEEIQESEENPDDENIPESEEVLESEEIVENETVLESEEIVESEEVPDDAEDDGDDDNVPESNEFPENEEAVESEEAVEVSEEADEVSEETGTKSKVDDDNDDDNDDDDLEPEEEQAADSAEGSQRDDDLEAEEEQAADSAEENRRDDDLEAEEDQAADSAEESRREPDETDNKSEEEEMIYSEEVIHQGFEDVTRNVIVEEEEDLAKVDDEDVSEHVDKIASEEEEDKDTEPMGVALKFGVGVALVLVAHVVLIRKWNDTGIAGSTETVEASVTATSPSTNVPEAVLRRQTLISEESAKNLLSSAGSDSFLGGEQQNKNTVKQPLREESLENVTKKYWEISPSSVKASFGNNSEDEDEDEDEAEYDKKSDQYLSSLPVDEESGGSEDLDEDLGEDVEEEDELEVEEEKLEGQGSENGEEIEEEEEEGDLEDEEITEDEDSDQGYVKPLIPKPKLAVDNIGVKVVEVEDIGDETESSDDEKPRASVFSSQVLKQKKSETLQEAEKELEKKNFEEAVKHFEALVEESRNSALIQHGLARSLDGLAEQRRSNELLEKAIAAYYNTLMLGSQLSDQLYSEVAYRCINRIFFQGQHKKAIPIHQIIMRRFPEDPNHANQMAVTYLTMNWVQEAKQVLSSTLQKWPNNGHALVLYGFILKTDDVDMTNSVTFLQKGIDSGEPGTVDGRFYFHLGDALVRLGRKEEAMKVNEEGVKKGLFLSKYQRSLYNVNRLTARPWWSPEETIYAQDFQKLVDNWRLIRSEGLSALSNTTKGLFQDESENLRDVGDWKQLELFARGQRMHKNCDKTPQTCQLIEKFPSSRNCRRGQVKFSIMEPGTHVWPHCGPTNCRLRAHLGLAVPSGTYIRVAEEMRTWEEGKLFVFDDSFEHEVWHNGTSLRLVLIVDVWHPELTDQEKKSLPAI